LKHFPVVSLLGPRQVGKTTLAQEIARSQPSHFFELEDVDALARLADPKLALERLEGLVVLDEVQRKPELFALLRVLADIISRQNAYPERNQTAFPDLSS
jgi:predicted AAA+ superfamily ATPase